MFNVLITKNLINIFPVTKKKKKVQTQKQNFEYLSSFSQLYIL